MLMGTCSGGSFSHVWKEGAATQLFPPPGQPLPEPGLGGTDRPCCLSALPPRAPRSTHAPLGEVHFPDRLWFVSEGPEL